MAKEHVMRPVDHRDAEYEWIGTTTRSTPDATRATREDEISQRAALLARLGYPKKHAEARLKANLAWEYERLGSASVGKRVGALVTASYKRAGVSTKRR